jgi:hypothetical protein
MAAWIWLFVDRQAQIFAKFLVLPAHRRQLLDQNFTGVVILLFY